MPSVCRAGSPRYRLSGEPPQFMVCSLRVSHAANILSSLELFQVQEEALLLVSPANPVAIQGACIAAIAL